jgi:ATP-dependent helicase HrpA
MNAATLDRNAVLTADFYKLRHLQKSNPARFAAEHERAREKFAARAQKRPKSTYAANLPVSDRAQEIAQLIAKHQVVVMTGETGSGKTTQLPKICLDAGRGTFGLIGHTQPRRLAARSVAERIAKELGETVGQSVGYKVRFTDNTAPHAFVKLMTDGILLAETQTDAFLNAYDTIIIDEAHERSLNIDFLLGYLKQLLPKRADLKVIITSATIDAQRFVEHFSTPDKPVPLVEVSGRTYPVEIRYRPVNDAHSDDEQEIEDAIADAVDECAIHGPGDVLVFLPGEREIRETMEILRRRYLNGPKRTALEILPLFARLSNEEQQRIFHPAGNTRRVVLATNVAETSLTVPGIRYVIDTGLARISRYAPRSKVQLLHIENVSQASANQRSGRCGRVGPGVCIRLFSEDDFVSRPAFTEPEILRSSLAAVILRLAALGFGRVEHFPFLEPPSGRAVADGYAELQDLGALSAEGVLTAIGKELARLPIEPRLGRMLVESKSRACLTEALVIVAALSVPDARERPLDAREAADRAHAKFSDEHSDFTALLNVWRWFQTINGEGDEDKLSHRKQVQACRDQFLNWLRLREWRDIYRQLADTLDDLGWKIPTPQIVRIPSFKNEPVLYEQLHRSVLAGLPTNVGVKDTESENYLGPRGLSFVVFPGSGVNKKGLRWLVAAELAETTRLFARTVARVEPEWIEDAAGERVSRHLFEPTWDEKTAQVIAFERVALHGLALIARRRVSANKLDGAIATEIFIREGLVGERYVLPNTYGANFLSANRALAKQIESLEHRARRQDVLVDEETQVAWYRARIPAGIGSGAAFEKWLGAQADDRALRMTEADLTRQGALAPTEEQFPKTLKCGDATLTLQYRFELGNAMDGVTAKVPLALLNTLDERDTSWLVPGLLREKLAAMFKLLPKAARGRVQPIPDAVTNFLECVAPKQEPLPSAALSFLKEFYALAVEPAQWPLAEIPPHLKMNFRVMGEGGQELAMGRDLAALRRELGGAAQAAFSGTSHSVEQTGLTSWAKIGTLPATLVIKRAQQTVNAFPSVVDEGATVGVKLIDTQAAADAAHRKGVVRLLRIELAAQLRNWEKGPSGFTQAALAFRPLIGTDALLTDYIDALTDRAFIGDDEPPRDEKAYKTQAQRAKTRLAPVADGLGKLLAGIGTELHAVNQLLAAPSGPGRVLIPTLKVWRDGLIYPGFLCKTPWTQLNHLPRYLEALRRRYAKVQDYPQREQRHGPVLAGFYGRLQVELAAATGPNSPKLDEIRWMTHELMVSLFAQELKTPYPVSLKRIEKVWQEYATALKS